MRAYACWVGLHAPDWWGEDWSWLWIEQKYELAAEHHGMLQNKFRFGAQAQLLRDLYADRVPRGLAGWTERHTVLNRLDPVNEKFITISGLDARLEGPHRNGIICDDLEGADADKSDVPNEASWKFLMDRANHLLKEPERALVVVGGTPHGPKPLVHRIRDLETDPPDAVEGAEGTLDNAKRSVWGLWWKPYLDESSQPQWPARYGMPYLEAELAAGRRSATKRRSNETQLFLRKWVGGGTQFDVEALKDRAWTATYAHSRQGVRRLVWRYPSEDIERETYQDEMGRWKERLVVTPKLAQVDPRHCRFTLHWDPAHKGPEERRTKRQDYTPSKHAISVVAFTPDCHALLIEYWKAEASIDVALGVFVKLYRKYVPWAWNYDPVGAQSWMVSHLETLERYKYRHITSTPTPWRGRQRCGRIARPSKKAQESPRVSILDKEEEIANQLELPFNEGWFHAHLSHAELWSEVERFGRTEDSFDLLDSLAQGPPVWKPKPSPEAIRAMKKRALMRELAQRNEVYSTPWSELPEGTSLEAPPAV